MSWEPTWRHSHIGGRRAPPRGFHSHFGPGAHCLCRRPGSFLEKWCISSAQVELAVLVSSAGGRVEGLQLEGDGSRGGLGLKVTV